MISTKPINARYARALSAVSAASLLSLACTTVPLVPFDILNDGTPTLFNQSCGAACAAP